MGYYISHSFRTQPKIYPTHPIATPVGYFGLKPLLNPKEISLQLQLGCKFVLFCFTFPFTSPQKKKKKKYQNGKRQCFITQNLRPILKQVDRPNIIVLQWDIYIYIYIYGLEHTTSIILWLFFIIRSETVPIIPN